MQKLALFIILLSAIFAGGCLRDASSSDNNFNSKNARVSSTSPEIKTSAENDPSRIRGTVVHISDGDTFIMQDESGERATVRIHAIDAPELAQPYGKESREHLRALIANQTVEVRRKKTDQFHRIVGAVFLNAKDIGLEMVDGGYAWHFKQYQKEQPPDERQAYASAEATALHKQLGLWRDARPIPPWEYRRQHQRRK